MKTTTQASNKWKTDSKSERTFITGMVSKKIKSKRMKFTSWFLLTKTVSNIKEKVQVEKISVIIFHLLYVLSFQGKNTAKY